MEQLGSRPPGSAQVTPAGAVAPPTAPCERGGGRHDRSGRALLQPRALLARLQRPRPRPRRRPRRSRCSSGPSSSPSSPRTSTSSSRSGWPVSRTRCTPAWTPPRPTDAPPSSSCATSARTWWPSIGRQERLLLEEIVPALEAEGVVVPFLGPADRRRAEGALRGLRGAHLPGAHPAGRRSGAPVPVHLEPVAEPGGPGRRPAVRRGPLRPGQGARRTSTGSSACPTR